MSRVTKRTNIRVEVTADNPWVGGNTEDGEIERCRELAASIQRHVDHYDGVIVTWDVEATCSHCGWAWTEGANDAHNGGCCGEDAKMMPPEEDAP